MDKAKGERDIKKEGMSNSARCWWEIKLGKGREGIQGLSSKEDDDDFEKRTFRGVEGAAPGVQS